MGKRREMIRKPNKQELKKMERIKSILEGEVNDQNIVQPIVSKVEVAKPKQIEDYIEWNGLRKPISNINFSDHSFVRIGERLNIKDTKQAKGTIKSMLKKAKCIGLVTDEEGRESVLYAHGRTGIHISPDLNKVITVIRQDVVSFEPIKNKMTELLEKEIRKLTRKENARVRQLTELKYEAKCEVAELELRSFRSRSQSVKMACQSRIKAIEISLEQLEQEITEIRNLKRQVSRSMIAVC